MRLFQSLNLTITKDVRLSSSMQPVCMSILVINVVMRQTPQSCRVRGYVRHASRDTSSLILAQPLQLLLDVVGGSAGAGMSLLGGGVITLLAGLGGRRGSAGGGLGSGNGSAGSRLGGGSRGADSGPGGSSGGAGGGLSDDGGGTGGRAGSGMTGAHGAVSGETDLSLDPVDGTSEAVGSGDVLVTGLGSSSTIGAGDGSRCVGSSAGSGSGGIVAGKTSAVLAGKGEELIALGALGNRDAVLVSPLLDLAIGPGVEESVSEGLLGVGGRAGDGGIGGFGVQGTETSIAADSSNKLITG